MNHFFPALDNYIYLNTPAQGLVSRQLVDYRTELMELELRQASIFTDGRAEFLNEVRTTVATYIDAPSHLTGLVPNFSFAFHKLLDGIETSSRFLLLKGDYPSINFEVESRGFDRVYANIDENLENNILAAVEREQPGYLCLSLVQYISGIKIELDFLKQLKLDFPALVIVVDATQYIGVEDFCFRESGIDILAASCYKWMHAGQGNAFICFKEDIVGKVKPKFTTFQTSQPFTNDRGSFMGHYEPGHLDLIAFGSLKKSIELIKNHGQEKIHRSIQKISKQAKEAFASRGLLKKEVANRKNHSSIYNLQLGEQVYHELSSQNILCAQRGSGIRIGFSYFNTSDDLKKLLNVIDLTK
jgi:selenocysteine lyase/cysteine desulfurase